MPRKVLPRPNEMGRLFVNVAVANALDLSKSLDFEVLVDTGASHLVLPAAWRPRLGDLETLQTMPAEMATGETVLAEVCGPIRLEVEGFRPIATEVMFIDMQPTDGRYEPLLGYIPLEQIPVTVDMARHRLVQVAADLR
jgi:predicted aspartyl protease